MMLPRQQWTGTSSNPVIPPMRVHALVTRMAHAAPCAGAVLAE
jgi:hypothetical protein